MENLLIKIQRYILIPPILVKSVVDMIASSCRDAKNVLVKVVKETKDFDELYSEEVENLDQ